MPGWLTVRDYRKSLILLVLILLTLEIGGYFTLVVGRPCWLDECHFLGTVRQFGSGITPAVLREYNEMSGPLPFMAYSQWGRIVGFETDRLRLLSIIVALVTYLVFHRLLWELTRSGPSALLGTLFLAFHPYMIGFSVFVYTDGMPIMFSVLALLAARHQRCVLFGLAVAAALLSRQYFAFLLLGASLHYLGQWRHEGGTNPRRMMSALSLSILPLLGLFFLWGGTSPDALAKDYWMKAGLRLHPSSLVLYISQLAAYLWPVLILHWRRIYDSWRTVLAAILLSGLYWLFPVEPLPLARELGITTVGHFNRALVRLFDHDAATHAVFTLAFTLGLPVLFFLVRDTFRRLKASDFGFALLLDLCVLAFLAIMPLSYHCWEKYFMPVVPLMIARMLLPETDHDPAPQTHAAR